MLKATQAKRSGAPKVILVQAQSCRQSFEVISTSLDAATIDASMVDGNVVVVLEDLVCISHRT